MTNKDEKIKNSNGKNEINGETKNENDDSSSSESLIEIRPNELVKESEISAFDLRAIVVKCSACYRQINHNTNKELRKHRKLGVITCKECYDFYGSEEFSQDENGYNYCTWCGNGGKLYVCDYCPNGFCDSCIRRNFGRAEISKSNKEGWKCFCCDRKRLKPKVKFCDYLLKSKKATKSEKKAPSTSKKNISEHWLQAAFDESDEACKKFHRKMAKLKAIGTNKTKSLRQIVKKMDQVINDHKTDLKNVIHNLTKQYQTYIDTHVNTLTNQKVEGQKVDIDCITLDENSVDVKELSDASVSISGAPTVQDDVNNSTTGNDTKNIDEKKIQAKLSLLKSSSESDDANEAEPAHDAESKDKDSPDADKKSPPENSDLKTKNINKSKSLSGEDNVTDTAKEKAKRRLSFGFSASSDSDFKDKPNIKEVLDNFSNKSSDEEGVSSKKSKNKSVEQVAPDEDPKLKQESAVSLIPCDKLLKDGETCIKIRNDVDSEDAIDKLVDSLCTSPLSKKKKSAPKKKPFCGPLSAKRAAAKRELMESSSSISLSSDEDEDQKKIQIDSKPVSKKEATTSKEIKSDSESSIGLSDTDSEDGRKAKNKKRSKASKKAEGSNSSDDFVPTKKKRKFDKLLHGALLSDDDDEKKPKERKRTIGKKRKIVSSDEEKAEKKKSDKSVSSTTDSEDEDVKKKKKPQKRRRIKELSGSSDKEENDKEENSPNKGRKNIRKIVSQKRLATTTKEAQLEEKERRRRIAERQRLYNKIEDTSVDGKEIITRKMVLEVDQDSKGEIVEIHPDLVCKLKPHQVNGVKFMWECTIESVKDLDKPGSGCILAHCMGLGKTLQVIAFLHTCLTNPIVGKVIKRAMIICPYNVSLNWASEFDHWLSDIEGDITVHQLTNVKTYSERIDILKYWFVEGGVIIVSYDIFRRFSQDKIPRVRAKEIAQIQKHLLDPGPDIVVCDEGHILKNDKSAVSIATSKLRTARRIVLTGTPLQNNLREYHCMLNFVKPNLLGTSKEFLNRFVNPIINGQYDDSNDYDVKLMKKRIHILHKLLEGCVQRCDYSALTKFLPAKHEFVISVKLSEVQIKMYKGYLERRLEAQKDSKVLGKTLFVDFNKLRCIWTHPYIYHISHEKAEYRKLLQEDDEEDDSFINDSDSESSASSTSKGSTSDDDKLIENIKNDNKRKDYRTRSKANDGDAESDVQEVNENEAKQWYHEFISEEDQYNVEISGKMVLLLDILKECEAIGDKIILFSQSLLCLDCIEDMLDHCETIEATEEDKNRDVIGTWTKGLDYFRMDGTTSADFRKSYIDMFNNPSNVRARLFLISTRAGSLGTNLVGANRVIIMDTSWNPSHDVQAIFRVYRFGQIKPVYIYRLIAQGTMEEKIYDRQVTKLSLSCRVVDEQQIDRHFSAADLAELYMFDPNATSNRPTPMLPKDRLLAEMLIKHKDWIVTYHEHDSLLQNQTEEDLTEEERQAAWTEYENEREGRVPPPPGFSNEDFMNFNKDPDLSQDYEGKLIPDLKVIVETLFERLKAQMPEPPTSLKFKERLLIAISGYRQILQEKHVKVLRMKQEYCSGGTVPNALNKYLVELGQALQSTGEYLSKLNEVVQKERIRVRLYEQQVNQMRANPAGQQRPATAAGNQPRFIFQRMPNQANIPTSFTYGNIRYQFSTVRPTTTPTPQTNIRVSAPKISEPTVILPDEDSYILPDAPTSSNNKTTVVIEEVS